MHGAESQTRATLDGNTAYARCSIRRFCATAASRIAKGFFPQRLFVSQGSGSWESAVFTRA
ncbi:hypothetical protein VFPFJ_01306 [Purpureocillium lilacinum]|uniref:Uncharacterized protein n=1 Tax=Purpureocillium lilacinum TaxID=33203 RepID=A0A179HXR9_PURLI|nr:hypothetical protein VFPFJ_01306 [Purpureocillium lilacinum]OAQ95197.1 hypothetical protein VFPFJ_01306 [Purpureocillium lilacinum]